MPMLPAVEPPEPLPAPALRAGAVVPGAPWQVVDDFFDAAEALRADFDAHFAAPYANGPRHQVWDYWFVPGSYTYLRTLPEKVLAPEVVQAFVRRLRHFALTQLGLSVVTHPFLSLYVDGCSQTLHNDAANGAVAYVHSLTRWEGRSFEGGETLVFRQQDYWRDGQFRQAGAGTRYYELLPSVFNRLVLFDDRLMHAVPELHGRMDPRQGRVVLHGHLKAGGLLLQGGAGTAALPALEALREALAGLLAHDGGAHDGVLTLRCRVDAGGGIDAPAVLLDRVFDLQGRQVPWPGLAALPALLAGHRLPPGAPGLLTLPLPLPRGG